VPEDAGSGETWKLVVGDTEGPQYGATWKRSIGTAEGCELRVASEVHRRQSRKMRETGKLEACIEGAAGNEKR
jgi:hypothetical protein